MRVEIPSMELNEISGKIIELSIRVHRELGPGLLENAYEACLMVELMHEGFNVERQKLLPIVYRGVTIDTGYRLDLIVENSLIVEVKAIERLMPIHEAKLLSYLKMTNLKLGLLINFNVRLLRDGVKRIVNNF